MRSWSAPPSIADHAGLDDIARLDQQLAVLVGDLAAIERALGLAADVDEHRVLADRDHGAADLIAGARALVRALGLR